jgi:hypothetical protein
MAAAFFIQIAYAVKAGSTAFHVGLRGFKTTVRLENGPFLGVNLSFETLQGLRCVSRAEDGAESFLVYMWLSKPDNGRRFRREPGLRTSQ